MAKTKHTLLFLVFKTLRSARMRININMPVKIIKIMVTAVGPLDALIICLLSRVLNHSVVSTKSGKK